MLDASGMLSEGRQVLQLEAAAVSALQDRLGDGFVAACRLLAETSGRVVVSGIGKSAVLSAGEACLGGGIIPAAQA